MKFVIEGDFVRGSSRSICRDFSQKEGNNLTILFSDSWATIASLGASWEAPYLWQFTVTFCSWASFFVFLNKLSFLCLYYVSGKAFNLTELGTWDWTHCIAFNNISISCWHFLKCFSCTKGVYIQSRIHKAFLASTNSSPWIRWCPHLNSLASWEVVLFLFLVPLHQLLTWWKNWQGTIFSLRVWKL